MRRTIQVNESRLVLFNQYWHVHSAKMSGTGPHMIKASGQMNPDRALIESIDMIDDLLGDRFIIGIDRVSAVMAS